MTKLEKAQKVISELTPAEKAEILQWFVRDLSDVNVEDPVGSWRDERDVEDIVRDIYSSRTT